MGRTRDEIYREGLLALRDGSAEREWFYFYNNLRLDKAIMRGHGENGWIGSRSPSCAS